MSECVWIVIKIKLVTVLLQPPKLRLQIIKQQWCHEPFLSKVLFLTQAGLEQLCCTTLPLPEEESSRLMCCLMGLSLHP